MRPRSVALAGLVLLASCSPGSAARSSRSEPRAVVARIVDATTVAIVVPAGVMADDASAPPDHRSQRREDDRRRLRESVRDLARILETVSGARVRVETPAASADAGAPPTASTASDAGAPPPADAGTQDGSAIDAGGPERSGAYRILVGALAEGVHGPAGVTAPYEQGFRVVVGERSAALYGESDLATSYAIYELLDRIGCRWFFPGPLGEVLPPPGPIALAPADERLAPSTAYRGVWYADDAWKRRNRQGGLKVEAGHALELDWVKDEDRARHPEWVAVVRGKPHPSRLRWSSPSLAEHIAGRILERRRETGAPSFSLSPDDGTDFDESPEDRALDPGVVDPTTRTPSLTDRFLFLANGVAARVAEVEPDVLLGFSAYVQYTQPPVRARVHPSLVPMIAPITYSRAHPMDDDRVPGNRDLRRAIEGWGELSARGTAIYFYGWFLAEPVAPNPMLTKWGRDVPYVLSHGARYWQPETFPNFETSMHALYMGMRLAFDARRRPEDVYADIDAKLYGAAGPAMHAYWKEVDRIWVETPEYSGGHFGHTRRFGPKELARMRALLDTAKAAARTDVERRRVELADDSLSLFEAFMAVRRAFVDGRFAGIAAAGEAYRKRTVELATKWKDAYAFTLTTWAPQTIAASYYDAFHKPAIEAANRIARTASVHAIVRTFRWRSDRSTAADARLLARDLDDSRWKTTDVGVDTWSALGLHDWFGSVSYRAKVRARAAGQRSYVWLSSVVGTARVFVNGKEARYAPESGDSQSPTAAGGALRFDVTGLLVDGENTLAIHAARTTLDELGIGGLTGPVVLFTDGPTPVSRLRRSVGADAPR